MENNLSIQNMHGYNLYMNMNSIEYHLYILASAVNLCQILISWCSLYVKHTNRKPESILSKNLKMPLPSLAFLPFLHPRPSNTKPPSTEPRKEPGLTFHYDGCLVGILISWFMKQSPHNWVGIFIPYKSPKQPGLFSLQNQLSSNILTETRHPRCTSTKRCCTIRQSPP